MRQTSNDRLMQMWHVVCAAQPPVPEPKGAAGRMPNERLTRALGERFGPSEPGLRCA